MTTKEGLKMNLLRPTKKQARTFLYGPPKIGKSSFGADSDSPIFVTTEDGVDNIQVSQFPKAQTWEQLLKNIAEVATEKHDYKTIVIDTINGAADLCAQHICATMFKNNWGAGGYQSFGQGASATSEEFRRILAALDMCRERGMMVLCLSHTGILNVKNPISGDYSKFTPELDKKIWARVSAWADIIGRVEFEHSIIEDSTGKGKAISSSTRLIRFCGSQAEDAGCRVGYSLPESIPLSFAEFAEHLGKNSKDVETLKEILKTVTKEQLTKSLAYLGIANLQEIEKAQAQKVAQLINRIKNLTEKKGNENA